MKCPACGKADVIPEQFGIAWCQSHSCRLWAERRDDGRWLLHMPVERVPWTSGTVADLECHRRLPNGISNGDYHPACCRFPKSCRAFDPGFATGRGRTELPVVWNDGYGWRSGPPDFSTSNLPDELQHEIKRRWDAVRVTLDNPTTLPHDPETS